MKQIIDARIFDILSDAQSHAEWDIASRLYPWDEDGMRPKHGAWVRSIVQALWRLYNRGLVGLFWVSHGEGVPGDRLWFRCSENTLQSEKVKEVQVDQKSI